MINESTARQDADDVEQAAAGPGVVPRVPQPIIAIVNAPLINDISRESLLQWLRPRKEYIAVTEARCLAANEDVKAVLRTVRDSFNEDLLETMRETRWDIDIEDLTDESLMEEITSSFMNKELPDTDEWFGSELKLNESTSDCKVLMKFLPGPLSRKVANEQEYRSGEAKASVRCLYKVVSNLALELEKENKEQSEQRKVTGDPPPKQCFHCGGDHGFIDCPTATETDKEAIRAKRRADERVFRRLMVECPGVNCVELDEPISCITVGGEVEENRAVNIHVTLQTAAGPVSINSPVQCLIVPGELEEFLLGTEILASLGIDVDRELEMLGVTRAARGTG
eukprot:jgi/Phyca11/125691/e_gw1.59.125.1